MRVCFRAITTSMLLVAAPMGCGSTATSSGAEGDAGGASPDGMGPVSDAGAVAAACDDLFSSIVACAVIMPAAAMHDAPRFRQACLNQASLPGSTTNVANLEACAQAFKASCSSNCSLPNVGTLPGGAPCSPPFDLQCQSGACVSLPPDAGSPNCGTCAPLIPVGQPCSAQAPGACAPGSYCDQGSTGTCVAYGMAGDPCSSTLCASDLYCAPSKQCSSKVALGGMCSTDQDCADALPCVGGTCSARGGPGAHCTDTGYSLPCENGLACDSVSSTCVAPSVAPGGTCGGSRQMCIFGSCSSKGLCPTLLADGQPCPTDDTAMCDVEAECDATGKCAIPGSTVCQ